MSLSSFAATPQEVLPQYEFGFRPGTPDVVEAAGVANQAMHELGLSGPDTDKNLEELTSAFTNLAAVGYDGRLYVRPSSLVGFDHMVNTAESKRKDGVASAYFYSNLWTPGTEQNSYTTDELNSGPSSHVARLAIFSATDTGYDPLLHDLGKPFDSYKDKNIDVNPDGEETQTNVLSDHKVAFESQHPGQSLDDVDHKDFVVLALMDRIRGIDTNEQVLSRGYMRIAKLGRRSVGGDSFVGYVRSCVGQLYFDRGCGYAYRFIGVGRSMGQTEA
jgi:hypothetical protein